MIYSLIRPILFLLEAERAHELAVSAVSHLPSALGSNPPLLPIEVAGLKFPNPIGLAAGLDKDARAYQGFLRLGFGSVEVGTLTPRPQAGNPRPRLFRLAEDRAAINRMGFNSEGQSAALARLSGPRRGIVGVNIGANKESSDRIEDYAIGVRAMSAVADYLTINISSPNTPGLRGLQNKREIAVLLKAVLAARGPSGPPVFLKVAPDLDIGSIDDIAQIALDRTVDAIVIGNTSVERSGLQNAHAKEAGGVSGAPLKALAHQRLIDFRIATGGRIPLVGVGGIETAEDAYARIRAGASLVQIYTALIYEGPTLARRMVRQLEGLLLRDGFSSVSSAIGIDIPVP